jgi:hypothetical protein
MFFVPYLKDGLCLMQKDKKAMLGGFNMKVIGLIGGMSWESSVEYYRIINEEVKRRLGGLHSARCLLYSVDFEEIERCQSEGDWKKAGETLSDVALSGKRGSRFYRHLYQYHAQGYRRHTGKNRHTYSTYCRYNSLSN